MITDRRSPVPLVGTKYEYLLDTVEAICASPKVKEFIIGITAQPESRRRAYRDAIALQYPHFVVLKGGFKHDNAWNLEQDLQAEVSARNYGRAKYSPERLGKPHKRSSGGSDRHTEDQIYSVYLTWRSQPR